MKYLRLDEILIDIMPEETIDFERLRFNGGENHIKLLSSVSEEVTIEAQVRNSDYVMELFMATDALRRAGALYICLLCPYVPYGRQDRVMVTGEPLSVKVFADLLNSQRYDKVYTLNNHSPVTTALIDNCIEIDDIDLLGNVINSQNTLLISPDAGAYKKTLRISQAYNMPIVQASKIRDVSNGQITGTKIDCEDLQGKDCYIIDDICDGGRTFIELSKVLKQANSGKVILYVSHGIFYYGVDSLRKNIDKIFTTNMFRQDKGVEKWDITILGLTKGELK